MKIRYFADTDTLLIEFRDVPVAETRDLDAMTNQSLSGQLCGYMQTVQTA